MKNRTNKETFRQPQKTNFFNIWLYAHKRSLSIASKKIFNQPISSFMTIMVIAITLALPTTLHITIKNARILTQAWDNALDFSAYLKIEVSEIQAIKLANIIGQRADIESVIFISKTDALKEFKEKSGFGESLKFLNENPLPHTLIIRPAKTNSNISIGLLNEELSNLPEIDFVQMDTDWVKRFNSILKIIENSIFIGSSLLGIAILIVIGNTIRLDIQNRYEEIEVLKLIGASNKFIRRPFLYTGILHGFSGGVLTLGLVWWGLYILEKPINKLTGLYHSEYTISSLSIAESAIIINSGMILGLLASWIATTRHLSRIEPK